MVADISLLSAWWQEPPVRDRTNNYDKLVSELWEQFRVLKKGGHDNTLLQEIQGNFEKLLTEKAPGNILVAMFQYKLYQLYLPLPEHQLLADDCLKRAVSCCFMADLLYEDSTVQFQSLDKSCAVKSLAREEDYGLRSLLAMIKEKLGPQATKEMEREVLRRYQEASRSEQLFC